MSASTLAAANEYDFEGSGAAGGSSASGGAGGGLSPQQETLDCLCEIYTLLKEDMLAGIWQKRSKFQDTTTAMAYEQHGFYEQEQLAYEAVSATDNGKMTCELYQNKAFLFDSM